MPYETIQTEIRDAIGVLTRNRPDRFNTLDAAEGVASFTEKRKPRWKGC